MIKTVVIDSVEKATELILDREYNAEIGRVRSPFLFRGMPDASYLLTTSLSRNCAQLQKQLEGRILDSFTKYALKEEPDLGDCVWRQMILGQHYGLPTRLLDWSHSSLIAMHFATVEDDIADTGKRDGIVWRVDMRELMNDLPAHYRQVLEDGKTTTFSVKTLMQVAPTTEQYDTDMGSRGIAILEPPSTDPRIINQYSYFSVIPLGVTDVERYFAENTENTVRYIIKREVRWALRDLLDQFNISERVVYPGLDGLSRWIARHYYVKQDPADNG